MRAPVREMRSAAVGLAVGSRAGARVEGSAVGGWAGAALPRCGVPARRWRWRCRFGDVLLAAALALVFPGSVLLYVGVGQEAAVYAIAAALALMVVGWVIGRE